MAVHPDDAGGYLRSEGAKPLVPGGSMLWGSGLSWAVGYRGRGFTGLASLTLIGN